MVPTLVNAGKAKALLGSRNKTDHLDAKGLNLLQRTRTLPTVWIPPAALRDQRELCRAGMFKRRQCTRLKDRILAALAKCALSVIAATVRFGKKGRTEMKGRIAKPPRNTQYVVYQLPRQTHMARMSHEPGDGLDRKAHIAIVADEGRAGIISKTVMMGFEGKTVAL